MDLAGKTVSHYLLGAPIGEGGMGVVYEAEDTRLGRKVAVKFLPPAAARETRSFSWNASAAKRVPLPH